MISYAAARLRLWTMRTVLFVLLLTFEVALAKQGGCAVAAFITRFRLTARRHGLAPVHASMDGSSRQGTNTSLVELPIDLTTPDDLTPLAFGVPPEPQHVVPSLTSLPLYQLALAGSCATLLADITMHPVDCVKTLQQSDMGMDMSLMDAATYLWTTSGLAGFYHGFLTYGFSDAAGGALKFSVWEIWKAKTADLKPTILYLWFGAALAFVASSVLIVPGELLKQQLQMSHFDSLPQAVAGIYAQDGLSGFFVGYEGVCYRDIPYTMLELGLYEIFKRFLLDARRRLSTDQSPSSLSAWEEVLAAAVTGAITAVVTTPLDTVKTKMMVENEFANANFVETFTATVHQHGWTSVFAGVVARVCWIVPFLSMYLPSYDFMKRQLLLMAQRKQEQQEIVSAATKNEPE